MSTQQRTKNEEYLIRNCWARFEGRYQTMLIAAAHDAGYAHFDIDLLDVARTLGFEKRGEVYFMFACFLLLALGEEF